MQLLWRTYDYEVDDPDNNWANYDYIKKNFPEKILHKDITAYSNFCIRTNDFPYDLPEKPKEHLILIRKKEYWNDKYLIDIISRLSKNWYYVMMNPISKQSRPTVWHMHLLKYE